MNLVTSVLAGIGAGCVLFVLVLAIGPCFVRGR